MRGKIPAQAPYEGGEPTMRKGSYSEELVKIRCHPDVDRLEHCLQMRNDIFRKKVLKRCGQVDKVQSEYRVGMRMVTPI